MATTTPNNGWAVPTSTDYVKDGATAIETLGDAIDTSVGTGLLAWQSWAPTLSGGWANGNGVWVAKYAKIGKTVHVQGFFTLGTTTTKGANLNCSLPVTAASNAGQPMTVFAIVAGAQAQLIGYLSNTTTFTIRAINVAGTYALPAAVSATVPAAWVTTDYFTFNFTYEAA